MEKKISVVSTTCKNCLFAKYDGDTQIDCELGKIEKIDAHPLYEIIGINDDEKKFFILNHHLCLHQRVAGWVHDNKSMDEMISLVKDEVKMNWGAIIILKNEHANDMSRVEKRISEILEQPKKPSWIGVISNDRDLELFWIISHLNNQGIRWAIESGEEDIRKYIDVIFNKFKKNKFVFYGVFESDKEIPSDFYQKMQGNVIENLMQYSVIKDGESLHCMTVNKVAHIKYQGNTGLNLENKIERESNVSLLLNSKDLR